MNILISDIKILAGTRSSNSVLKGTSLASLPSIRDAYLIIEDGQIADYGGMKELKRKATSFDEHYIATGKIILPCWCDSHTHLVFAGYREHEFVRKIKGETYEQIAAGGGGILLSAQQLHEMSEDELFIVSFRRLQEVIRMGTGAIEIKSGYGLSIEGEMKMLRVIRRLKQTASIPVRSTFLGAHTFPAAYKDNREGYIKMIIEQMIPVIASEKLADYMDVFCDQGFFTVEETLRICKAGSAFSIFPKIHANQLSVSGGVEAAIHAGAISVDHLEKMDSHAIQALAGSGTIGTLLPAAAFFLRMEYPPARQMIDAGCAIALASDHNPGSSPSGNMNFVVSLACIQMKMLPEEAINAATINGAYAMGLGEEIGSVTVGKKANLILTQPVSSIAYLPYAFGQHHIENVMIGGEWVKDLNMNQQHRN